MIFCMKINIKVFYNLISSFLVTITRHAQGTQNNKFSISLQYLKKEGRSEVDFLHIAKHQTFLQVDTINFGLCASHAQTMQNNKFAIFQEWSSVLIKLYRGNNLNK